MYLRLQDFKIVTKYSFVIFRITSQLKLCGEKVTNKYMLEKTFFIFQVSNMLLNNNIKKNDLKSIMTRVLAFLWQKIMNF